MNLVHVVRRIVALLVVLLVPVELLHTSYLVRTVSCVSYYRYTRSW